ncbi:carbon-nitrogen hydrolase family protein [Lentibacillus lipolyticus]|nr:carbon-nitrogen hydrolase family protein [Lentibacillus lipolyticus]
MGDKKANLQTITSIMEKASHERADLVLFPELSLSGYFIQDVNETMAEPIDGESIQYIRELCRRLDVHVVFPWPELGEAGKIYNAACLLSNKGDVIGNYREVHLYDTEKEIFTPGDTFKVFDTELGNIGMMICFDLDFPESARVL